MIDIDLLEQVNYPDEKESYMIWDGLDYDDTIKGLEFTLSFAKGQLRKDTQDTLTELERRWKDRQEKQAANKNISSKESKKSRKVALPDTANTSPPI